jgi:LmbE family N-acetylglucosaminyl deacetylase
MPAAPRQTKIVKQPLTEYTDLHTWTHYFQVQPGMKKNQSFDFVSIGKEFDLRQHEEAAQTILIIAPHPDDDVIGMGGTMRLLADEGKTVFTVYVTHGGSAPSPECTEAIVRRSEAIAALHSVRAAGAFFLNHTGSLLAGSTAAKAGRQLLQIINLLKPAEIYMPSPFERHPTHCRVTRVTLQALKNQTGSAPRAWGYSVWGGIYGLPGTRMVDISRAVRAKRKAIRQHATQTAGKPYDTGILGRNAYEGIFAQTHAKQHMAWAETFIDMAILLAWPGTDILVRAIAGHQAPAAKDISR